MGEKNNKNETKKTCVSIQPCNLESAENHNFRKTELVGTRPELACDNRYFLKESALNRLANIKIAYLKTTGQRLQKKASPILEAVVTGIMTAEQAKRFCELLESTFDVEVLSWALHVDEGHYDPETGEWISNPHGHFIFDTTIRDHTLRKVAKRKHGKCVRDENGNVIIVERDKYGTKRKLSKADLSKMQDLAAAVTGWERGKPSTISHIGALLYKAEKLREDIEILTKREEKLSNTVSNLERALLDNKETAKNDIGELQNCARGIVARYKMQKFVNEDDSNREIRQELDRQCVKLIRVTERNVDDEQTSSLTQYILNLNQEICRFIELLLQLYNSVIGSAIKRQEEERRKLKELSTINSAKGFVNTLLRKPADEKAKEMAKAIEDASNTNQQLQSSLDTTKKEKEKLEQELQEERQKSLDYRQENERLQAYQKNVTKLVGRIYWTIIENVSPKDLQRLHDLGIDTLFGQRDWENIKSAAGRNDSKESDIDNGIER